MKCTDPFDTLYLLVIAFAFLIKNTHPANEITVTVTVSVSVTVTVTVTVTMTVTVTVTVTVTMWPLDEG